MGVITNPDLAYFYGLIIGGGTLSADTITIKFPYRGWPASDFNIPLEWFKDSVNMLVPLAQELFNAKAEPIVDTNKHTPEFYLVIRNIPQVVFQFFNSFGIAPMGELRAHASIKYLKEVLDLKSKKSFVKGLADVIGSCQASHRRAYGKDEESFVSAIVSFEILGSNWNLPFELCTLLHDLEIPTDQVLWQHPNMHAGRNETAYWKKGHKVRVRAADLVRIGYGLECKRIGLQKLIEMERQREALKHGSLCPNRRYSARRKVRHNDEHDDTLPPAVRGHMIHYTHICWALGCPHAPVDWLQKKIETLNTPRLDGFQ